MADPWDKWDPDELRRIVADYQGGATIKKLAMRYRHDGTNISKYLYHLGVLKRVIKAAQRKPRTVGHRSTPQLRTLSWVLLKASHILGRPPTEYEIGRILETIHCHGGRYIERGAETHERENVQAHSAGV